MMDARSSESKELVDDFLLLGQKDRDRIIHKLSGTTKEIFLIRLEQAGKKEALLLSDRNNQASAAEDCSPWLSACLDAEHRSSFSALRNGFQMTVRAQRSLREAILEASNSSGNRQAGPALSAANNGNIPQRDNPSLIDRMVSFLASKARLS